MIKTNEYYHQQQLNWHIVFNEMEPTNHNNYTSVRSVYMKVHDMAIDVTFSLTRKLSFVVNTSTGKDRNSGWSAALCEYEGAGIKCGLHYCVAWKMSLHGGGVVSIGPELKETLAAHTHSREFRKSAKKARAEWTVHASLIVLNYSCPSST